VEGDLIELEIDEWEASATPKKGLEALIPKSEGGLTVVLDTALTPELRAEGLAREIINRVQKLRKDTGLEVSDRIRLGVFGDDADLGEALRLFGGLIQAETLAVELETGSATDFAGYETDREVDLDGITAIIALARVNRN
jgi:isoleucyl-tRNA synthetase